MIRDGNTVVILRLMDNPRLNDQDLSRHDVLTKIVAEAGLDADDLMNDITSDSIKGELKENTEEAVRRGAFGAPTFFVGDDMFFGNDRLDFVREALERAG